VIVSCEMFPAQQPEFGNDIANQDSPFEYSDNRALGYHNGDGVCDL